MVSIDHDNKRLIQTVNNEMFIDRLLHIILVLAKYSSYILKQKKITPLDDPRTPTCHAPRGYTPVTYGAYWPINNLKSLIVVILVIVRLTLEGGNTLRREALLLPIRIAIALWNELFPFLRRQ